MKNRALKSQNHPNPVILSAFSENGVKLYIKPNFEHFMKKVKNDFFKFSKKKTLKHIINFFLVFSYVTGPT